MKKLSILWLSISLIAYLNGAEEAQKLLKKKHELPAGAVVNSVNFSNDGKLAAGLIKNKIPIWNFSDDSFTELDITSRALGDIAWSPDNIQLAASNGKAIELINTSNAKSLLIQNTIIPKLPTGVVKYMVPSNPSWNYDGSQLVWGSFQQRGTNFVSIWNVVQQRMVHNLRRHKSYVNAVRYHPTDVVLASGSADSNTGAGLRTGTICIWDMRSGQCTQDLRGHGLTKPVSLDWNSNGYLLASASGTTVHIWDIRNNQCIQLPGADARAFLTDLCWHPNGQFLAASSRNQTVSLWNTHDETCLQVLPADTSSTDHRSAPITVPRKQPGVFSVDWNQEGTLLVTGSADGIVRTWEYQQKEDDEGPVPGDDGGSSPGGSSPDGDGGGEEEKELAQSNLAVADSAGITMFSLTKANTLRKDSRAEIGRIRSMSYHPITSTLTALKDNGSDYLAYHPSGELLTIASMHDEKAALSLYDVKDNGFEHLDTSYELDRVCSITYNPPGKYLAATNPITNKVTTFLLDIALQFKKVGTFPTWGKGSAYSTYHPTRQLFATANTDSNTVTLFTGDSFGQLLIRGIYNSGGKAPVSLAFDPYGQYLVVLHAESNDIVILKPEVGRLTPIVRHQLAPANSMTSPVPVALAFRPLEHKKEPSSENITDMTTYERVCFLKRIARQKLEEPRKKLWKTYILTEEAHAALDAWLKDQTEDSLLLNRLFAAYNKRKYDQDSYDYMAWNEIAEKIKAYQ